MSLAITSQIVLVVSSKTLLREGLKLLLEESLGVTVVATPDVRSVPHLVAELNAGTIVLECTDTRTPNLEWLFKHWHRPLRIVIIGWDDNRMVLLARSNVKKATLKNLVEAVSGRKDVED